MRRTREARAAHGNMQRVKTVWRHARLVLTTVDGNWDVVDDGALCAVDGLIAWIGRDAELPRAGDVEEVDLGGALLTPGLIDCHTHLVYGGDRASEFEQRLGGATYEEIARAGGGIRSTVAATRAASDDELFASAATRARTLAGEGVTTIEVKSGYGLSREHEARCLRVARRLGSELPLDVCVTSLGAHALPPEHAGNADAYIDGVCDWLVDQADEGIVDAVDAFCETIAFTPAQVQRVFEAARSLGLPVKLHAEQLSNQGGAVLAAGFGALSCDHLEYLDQAGVDALAAAGTVATLLPGAFYFIRERQLPPVAALQAAGVPIAIATDHNPGSSPVFSLLLMLNMACTLFALTPEEAFAGVTVHAARALGLRDRGRLAPGLRADLAIFDVEHPRELAYRFGVNPCRGRVRSGVLS
ncbi:MAG: imidazolonepropionase [Gaiellales bacterium]